MIVYLALPEDGTVCPHTLVGAAIRASLRGFLQDPLEVNKTRARECNMYMYRNMRVGEVQ